MSLDTSLLSLEENISLHDRPTNISFLLLTDTDIITKTDITKNMNLTCAHTDKHTHPYIEIVVFLSYLIL